MTSCLYSKLTKRAQKHSTTARLNEKPYVIEYLDSKKSTCLNCHVIVGTHKKLGTGFNEANAITEFTGDPANTLLFIGSIKDYTLMYQVAGRVFRAEAPIVLFPRFSDFAGFGISFSDTHISTLTELITDQIPECTISSALKKQIEDVANVPVEEVDDGETFVYVPAESDVAEIAEIAESDQEGD